MAKKQDHYSGRDKPNMRPSSNQQAVQFVQDQHGPGYANDTKNDWRRGANEDATTRPGFDKSKPSKRK